MVGAILSGVGLGLAIRNGSSTGGVDIVQKILYKYLKMPFSASLIIVDGIIVLTAGIYFTDIFVIIYGAMFIYISGFVMDAIIFNGFNSRCVNIVTEYPEAIKEKIDSKLVTRGISDPREASDEQIYYATVAVMKERMLENRASFKSRKKARHCDRV